jgi:hypothetical protein
MLVERIVHLNKDDMIKAYTMYLRSVGIKEKIKNIVHRQGASGQVHFVEITIPNGIDEKESDR